MEGLQAQGLEDQEIQGALDEVGLGGIHGAKLGRLILTVKM
jgi:hypothetical protein